MKILWGVIIVMLAILVCLLFGCGRFIAPGEAQPFRGKFAPPPGTCYHGAGQDQGSFRAYCEGMAGRLPVISMYYSGLSLKYGFKNLFEKMEEFPDTYPQLGLQMLGKTDGKPALFTDKVVQGDFDHRIRELAQGMKALNRPAFIRVGYEFNGPWNGYEPRSFIAAWKQIHRIFQEEGAENVAFVWNWAADTKKGEQFMPFYPGDELVDWWGFNVFDVKAFDKPATLDFIAEARRRGKPLMIGESTPRVVTTLKGRESWDEWFAPYFELIERHDVEAFCYINWNWPSYEAFPQWHHWGDCRIESNRELRDLLYGEMGKPRYINGDSFQAMTNEFMQALK